jgi:hypothetical protein
MSSCLRHSSPQARQISAHRPQNSSANSESRRQNTDVSAIPVQANALLHHFDVLFLQARGGAMLAFLRACQAGFNAASILFVSHNSSPFNKTPRRDSPDFKDFGRDF